MMHKDTLLGPSGLTDQSPFGPMALLAHDPSDKDEINEAESDEISGGGAQINHNESDGPDESQELSEKDSEEVSGGGLVVGTLHS